MISNHERKRGPERVYKRRGAKGRIVDHIIPFCIGAYRNSPGDEAVGHLPSNELLIQGDSVVDYKITHSPGMRCHFWEVSGKEYRSKEPVKE